MDLAITHCFTEPAKKPCTPTKIFVVIYSEHAKIFVTFILKQYVMFAIAFSVKPYLF